MHTAWKCNTAAGERKRKCKREGVDGREGKRCVRTKVKNKRENERLADINTKVMPSLNGKTDLVFQKKCNEHRMKNQESWASKKNIAKF